MGEVFARKTGWIRVDREKRAEREKGKREDGDRGEIFRGDSWSAGLEPAQAEPN